MHSVVQGDGLWDIEHHAAKVTDCIAVEQIPLAHQCPAYNDADDTDVLELVCGWGQLEGYCQDQDEQYDEFLEGQEGSQRHNGKTVRRQDIAEAHE